MRATTAISCLLMLALAGHADAQTSAEHLTFDRPEAWALKYFTSATLLTGLNTPDEDQAGAIALAFEAGWLPTLSTAQQRVGFNGTELQDLNKAPVFFRPRLAVGLPHRVSIIAGLAPPIRAFDVTPRLFALGLQWAMYESENWQIGWRAHGQIGTVTAAITCPPSVLRFAPGSPNNTVGCDAESADVTTLRYGGLELQVARRMARRVAPHAAVGVNALDSAFQTNAHTFGEPDRTRMEAQGVTVSGSIGIGIALSDRLAFATDVFYSPLTVRRSTNGPRSTDSLLNARALVSYRIKR